jgi:hypothetical protein
MSYRLPTIEQCFGADSMSESDKRESYIIACSQWMNDNALSDALTIGLPVTVIEFWFDKIHIVRELSIQ